MMSWTFLARRECWKLITLKVLSHIFGVSVMRRSCKDFVLCIYVKSVFYINKVIFALYFIKWVTLSDVFNN